MNDETLTLLFDLHATEIARLQASNNNLMNGFQTLLDYVKAARTENNLLKDMILKLSMNAVEVSEYLKKMRTADEPQRSLNRLDEYWDRLN